MVAPVREAVASRVTTEAFAMPVGWVPTESAARGLRQGDSTKAASYLQLWRHVTAVRRRAPRQWAPRVTAPTSVGSWFFSPASTHRGEVRLRQGGRPPFQPPGPRPRLSPGMPAHVPVDTRGGPIRRPRAG